MNDQRRHIGDVVILFIQIPFVHAYRLFIGNGGTALAAGVDGGHEIINRRLFRHVLFLHALGQVMVFRNAETGGKHLLKRLIVGDDQPLVAEHQITVGNPVQDMLGCDGLNVQQMQLINGNSIAHNRRHKTQRRCGNRDIRRPEGGD